MINLLLASIFFILPAYLANLTPVVFKKLKFPMGKPISEKWLGAHKTWGGLIYGSSVGILTVYGQRYLTEFEFFYQIAIWDYTWQYMILFGGLMGLGAMVGDLVKSFIKRRLKIKPGAPFIPFDQIDFLIGAIAFTIFWFPGWSIVIILLIITPLLHFLTNVVGYLLGFKKVWW